MKTESENVQRWDDIIFENRNKAYGAYAIRKSYDDNVLTGLTISLSVGCLIFFSSFLSVKEKTSIVEIPDGTFYPMPPPDFKPVITAKTPPTAPKPFKKDLFPIATTKVDVPDEKVVEPTIPESPGGTVSTVNPEDGLGQSGASIGDEVIPEPPKPPFVLYAEHMPA